MDELRKITNDATPGPWQHNPEAHCPVTSEEHDEWVVAEASWGLVLAGADARFIATFDPQLVGALLDVVDVAREMVRSSAPAPDSAFRLSELEAALGRLDALH